MCHNLPVNSTSSLSNWHVGGGSQHYVELTSWSYSKKIWKFLSLLNIGWDESLCRKTSCTWTVFLKTARYSLKKNTAGKRVRKYLQLLSVPTAKVFSKLHVVLFELHLRLQLLFHFCVLVLRHCCFTFTQFVHLLPWALKIRLRRCWRDLRMM